MPSPPRLARSKTDMGWSGEGPWDYTPLQEPFLTSELARLSNTRSIPLSKCHVYPGQVSTRLDSVSFQPSPDQDESSQDRVGGGQWDIGGKRWTYSAVFDGHGGHETVDYVHRHLPAIMHARLSSLSPTSPPDRVSAVLASAITSVDQKIVDDVLSIFPNEAALQSATMRDVRQLMGDNQGPLLRAMRGSTAIVGLVDSERQNLWVANLGDCQAVLGTRLPGGKWKATLLSDLHNGSNRREVERVLSEHPREECFQRQRLFGMLSPTRACGDLPFKLPPVYTTKVFLKANPPYSLFIPPAAFESLNQSPPYVSNTPDVRHVKLNTSTPQGNHGEDRFLILCSDGLADLLSEESSWVQSVGAKIDEMEGRRGSSAPSLSDDIRNNLALHLLRHAIGGDNLEVASRALTVEMPGRWMDDTSISVLLF